MSHPTLQPQPSAIKHQNCEGHWDQWCIEWPPKLTVCSACGQPLKLVGYDNHTGTSYRHIT